MAKSIANSKQQENKDIPHVTNFTFTKYHEIWNSRCVLIENLFADKDSHSIPLTKDIIRHIILEYLPVFPETLNYFHFWELYVHLIDSCIKSIPYYESNSISNIDCMLIFGTIADYLGACFTGESRLRSNGDFAWRIDGSLGYKESYGRFFRLHEDTVKYSISSQPIITRTLEGIWDSNVLKYSYAGDADYRRSFYLEQSNVNVNPESRQECIKSFDSLIRLLGWHKKEGRKWEWLFTFDIFADYYQLNLNDKENENKK